MTLSKKTVAENPMQPRAEFKVYPAGALVRVRDICGDRKNGRPGLLPIHPSTWYEWVNTGQVPPGRKLGGNTTVWPIELVLALGTGDTSPNRSPT